MSTTFEPKEVKSMASGIPLKPWAKACKKALIDKDMSMNDLANVTGYSRQHLSAVINCRIINYTCQEVIC